MNILLLGGSGLIGSRLSKALLAAGHSLTLLSRHAGCAADYTPIQADFAALQSPNDWLPHLAGIDIVINAVGIFAESARQTFADIHCAAPQALFSACELAGVRRVIQISALGAAPDAPTAYWRSKGIADASLAESNLDWTIVRPSLIYAPEGASCRVFCSLATLPCLTHLSGAADVQPVHIDDLIALLIKLAAQPMASKQVINAVGPTAMPLSHWWQSLRQAMGLAPALTMAIAPWLQNLAARYLPNSLLTPDSLSMLRSGNSADARPFATLLGRAPQPALPTQQDKTEVRRHAQLSWLLPLLQLSIALVWFGTAAVSLWAWPRAESYALLGKTGIPSAWQPLLFYGSVAMDTLFGVLCLLGKGWRLQLCLVLTYSIIIACKLPEFLWHPFGPLLKNLPILALLILFYQLAHKPSARH
ncbi:SDR family oxidoreductase [Iodobacter sp. CM08]|uniref:SDR family oxidoreductase n=1 Tax=Iodobacter sp. CM08 TaxID=3085902 RepID=UPI002981D549|nr:SDR family oxidoreductase [Iodobacter sp. CM08]MDW5418069.1 SDR family oxidoreductase [Iodobacter sp. CM08]